MSVLFDLQNAEDFTDADHAIADYLLTHADEVEGLSIGTLATQTHTSNASVIRLCRKLGAKGFKDFKLSFIREAERAPEILPDIDVNHPFHGDNTPSAIAGNIAEVHSFAVEAVQQAVSIRDVQKAARMIHGAERLFLYGTGESGLIVRIFGQRLTRIGYLSICAQEYDEPYFLVRHAKKSDAALFVSYSGSGLVQFSLDRKLLAGLGCPTILISSNPKVKGFDHKVLYPRAELVKDNITTFYSTEASLLVLDEIYGILFSMDYERVSKEKRSLDNVLRELMPSIGRV